MSGIEIGDNINYMDTMVFTQRYSTPILLVSSNALSYTEIDFELTVRNQYRSPFKEFLLHKAQADTLYGFRRFNQCEPIWVGGKYGNGC